MARHGKTNNVVAALFDKALVKGEAKKNGRKRDWNYVGDLEEQYKVRFTENLCELWHWGTKTLQYDLGNKKILSYGGWSNSDRDSLNTMLDCLGHTSDEYFRIQQGELNLISEKSEVIA